jgi:glycosyltransferase involved in cell wall biosynthesis
MASEIKNILIVSVMQNWGGGEEFILKLCKGLTQYNYIIATALGESSNIFKKKKLNIVENKYLSKIYKINNRWSISSIIKSIYKIKLTSFSLTKLIYKNRIELLIANGNFAALFSILPSLLMRKKLIVIQHLIYNTNSFEASLLKIIIKFSSIFICVSNAVLENIISIIGVKYKSKLQVIYNGIELPSDEKIFSTHTDKIIKLGMVGSIIRIKGIDLVINALTDITHTYNNVHLYIYGTPNNQEDSINYQKELVDKVKTNSVENKIHFMGYEENKDKIYSSVDVIINYTIIPEAFPYSVLEAMSYYKIVIAPKVGGPKEIILDKVNGYLVNSNNITSLNEKLEFIVKEFLSGSLNNVKENARKTIEDKFSLSIFIGKYKVLFDSLLN